MVRAILYVGLACLTLYGCGKATYDVTTSVQAAVAQVAGVFR